MKIGGLQKLTLLDFPGHTACTVFTVGCNLRCPFCHNSDLVFGNVDTKYCTEDDVFSLLEKRKGVLDGVCITGGEPLLNGDIVDFISDIKSKGFSVKLDTNGFLPHKLKELIEKKLLDYVAMDIKNSEEKYGITVGIDKIDISGVKESIKLLNTSGIDHEFRTTAVKEFHTTDDFVKIAEMIKGADKYFIQNFVDSGKNICEGLHPMLPSELKTAKNLVGEYIQYTEIRGI